MYTQDRYTTNCRWELNMCALVIDYSNFQREYYMNITNIQEKQKKHKALMIPKQSAKPYSNHSQDMACSKCLPSSWHWWVCTRFRSSWEARLRAESSKSWLRWRRRRFPASSDWHPPKNKIYMNWIPPRYHKTGSQESRSLVSRSRCTRLQLWSHELRWNCFLVCEHWRIWSNNSIVYLPSYKYWSWERSI